MRRLILIFSMILFLAGCDKSKEFAKSLDRVSGYVDTGLQLIDRQTAAGQMSKETGIAAATALQEINTFNGQLIAETKKYQSADGQRLELTGDGKAKILAIVQSSKTVATNLLNNPDFLKTPEEKRRQLTLLVRDISETITALAELAAAIKPTPAGGAK